MATPDNHYAEPLDATESMLRSATGVLMDALTANAANIHYATPGQWGGGRYLPLPSLSQLDGTVATPEPGLQMDCSRTIVCLGNVSQDGMLTRLGGPAATSATFYDDLAHVTQETARKGDIGVIGVDGSIHAFMVRSALGASTMKVFENGSEDGPRIITLAEQLAAHPGQPVTFLRLPVPQT